MLVLSATDLQVSNDAVGQTRLLRASIPSGQRSIKERCLCDERQACLLDLERGVIGTPFSQRLNAPIDGVISRRDSSFQTNFSQPPNILLMASYCNGAMKRQQAYIFVDDGYPEAADYDTNYVSYSPEVPGSYERAVEECRRRCVTPAEPTTRTGYQSHRSCAWTRLKGFSRFLGKQARRCRRALPLNSRLPLDAWTFANRRRPGGLNTLIATRGAGHA